MAGDPPIPAGVVGLRLKEQQLRSAVSVPLTAEQLWRQAVQSQRGFHSSPSGPADAYRRTPATLPRDLSGPGAPAGKGYETFAAIQVLDKDGRRVAVGADYFDGGGTDNHGEARAIKGLERDGPSEVPGGKLMVVVEKDPCPSCEQRLLEYARKRRVTVIEIHVPERASMTNPTRMVTPKQAARTSFQAERPATSIRRLRTIKVPGGSEMLEIHPPAGMSPRTAVVGTLANIVAAVALGILQQEFKDEMLKTLAKMPKPKVDRRAAGDYFSDPATAKAMRLIDLMNKNLGKLTSELQDHHLKVIGETNLEVMAIAVSRLSEDARLAFLTGLSDQVQIYGSELLTVRDNIEAARQLEAKSVDAAKGAEDLAKLLDRVLVADFLLKQGFSLDEIVQMYENLTNYAARVRRVFQDLATLQQQVDKCINEQSQLASSVNKLYWHISLSRIAEELKKRGAQ
jgi:hypothetical protein